MKIGLLKYKDKEHIFKLNEDSFSLEIENIYDRKAVSPEEVMEFMSSDDWFQERNIILTGIEFGTEKKINFNVKSIYRQGINTYSAMLHSYLIYRDTIDTFNALQIHSKELNAFYNINKAFEHVKFEENGKLNLSLKDHDSSLDHFEFKHNNSTIEGNFSISRKYSSDFTKPVELASTLNLHFEETDDLNYGEDLIFLLRKFFDFTTYRRNHSIDKILLKKYDFAKGKYFIIGDFFVNQYTSTSQETKDNVKSRIIEYSLVKDSLPVLLNNLAEEKIYLKHIPINYNDSKNVTSARYIMVTAGFEWQFQSLHEKKMLEGEDKYKDLRETIITFLESNISKETGKRKKYLKSLKKEISRKDSSLSDKLEWTFDKYDTILRPFVERIFQLNGIDSTEYNYESIAFRIQTQRNNTAHGSIDKKPSSYLVLDLIALEWLYYTMVLDDAGMSTKDIKKSLNNLFNLGALV